MADIAPELQPEEGDVGEVKTIFTPRGVSFIDKLTQGAIAEIKEFKIMKPSDYKAFGDFAAQSFHSRREFLKDEYKDSGISRDGSFYGLTPFFSTI